MTVKDLIKRLQEYPEDMHIVAPIWEPDDAKGEAEEMGQPITDAEANWVIDQAGRKHDAELGISWMTLDHWITEVVRARGPS